MNFDDSYAYIPLLATAAFSVLLLVLLVIIRRRSTARVSFITFIATGLIFFSSIITAFSLLSGNTNGNAFIWHTIILFFALFLFLPYCLVLATFEPKKIDKLVPKSKNIELSQQASTPSDSTLQQQKELSEIDLSMLDISRDFMVHASDAYISDKGMTTFLEYINNTIKEQINADGAALFMIDDFEDVIAVKAFEGDFPPPYKLPSDMPHKPVRVATNFKFASFPLRDNIFGDIATLGKPELITKPEMDSRVYQNGPEEFLECGSYIIVPMKVMDVVIGLTAFARKKGSELFTEEDLKVAETLSDFAATTIKNVQTVADIIEQSEISKESEIASRVQESLKPAKLPSIQGLQLGAMWNPAKGVCGDYYDVIISRKDRISFIMSDIAGKGMTSIVIMTMIRAMLKLVVNTTQSAGKILTWINKGIANESFSLDHFGSLALLNYDPTTSTLNFATGGGTPVYYFDAEKNTCTLISENSEPIGVEKSSEYKDFVQNVKKGDIIITYTDGLVEALNESGQQYTKEPLLKLVVDNHNKPSKEIINLIKSDLKKFSGNVNQFDDETLLLIKIQ